MNTPTRSSSLLALAALGALTTPVQAAPQRDDASPNRLTEIAAQAYVYAYPMVLMEITRRVATNVPEPVRACAPMNQFAHLRQFPDHTFRDVVRPNVDTLYSTLWFDVSREPLVLSVPDDVERFYLLPMLDMWTEVFAAPGTRTLQSSGGSFAVVGPRWSGELPDGVEAIRSPTAIGWIIGRTQTNGTSDYEVVHRIQGGLRATPLGHWGEVYEPPESSPVVPDWDMKTPPPEQVADMSAAEYFTLFADLLKDNPPHEIDWSMLALLQTIGIVPGEDFELDHLDATTRASLTAGVREGHARIRNHATRPGHLVNGWKMGLEGLGSYGASYLQRATVAWFGLGANVPDDAVYPMCAVDAAGAPFHGDRSYVMHFEKDELPPVNAFWSLSLYDESMYLVDNPIGRYAIGDRDDLRLDTDGSLDVYIQHDAPPGDLATNWLPAPAGPFDLVLRLYWPRPAVLLGEWAPPAVVPVEQQ